MEPTNVTPPSDRDAELEALLRASYPLIKDNGFSARVLAALPARSSRPSTRPWMILGGALAGVTIAFAGGAFSPRLDAGLAESLRTLALLATDPWVAFAFTLTGLVLVYVFRGGLPTRFRL